MTEDDITGNVRRLPAPAVVTAGEGGGATVAASAVSAAHGAAATGSEARIPDTGGPGTVILL